MKPREVYSKTMPFVWAKLLLGLATIVISIVLFAILMGIAFLFKSGGAAFFMFIIWLAATGAVNFIINHWFGYLVKAGHIAVITEAVTTGRVPDNQVEYGKQMVKDRFATSNVYFMVDKLVSAAVKQLQNGFEKVGGALGNIVPGMNAVVSIGKLFIGIALGYIDECCLGYTFLKKEQGAFKSAADGVVIYAQNWKKLLKDAAKTTATVVGLMIAATLVSLLFFGLIFRVLGLSGIWGFVAFAFACFIAWLIKSVFIDSYMMVKMMVSYMQEAPTTVITFDLYGKLCGLSRKFKELFNKGQQEDPTPQPAYAAAGAAGTVQSSASAGDKPVFCGECGAKNKSGTRFCGECGKPIT
ncbi:MAG: zinc ribbon domain-containing protein [Oscillospiraceae bacterium]|nr:zinc ribbon domain-containing protein [Oscillospiraceae bacterium]